MGYEAVIEREEALSASCCEKGAVVYVRSVGTGFNAKVSRELLQAHSSSVVEGVRPLNGKTKVCGLGT